MVDLQMVRESYAKREVANIALIPSSDNPADPLTKIKGNEALIKLMRSGRIDHPISQYVVEPSTRHRYI